MAPDSFLFYNGHDLQASEGENHAQYDREFIVGQND